LNAVQIARSLPRQLAELFLDAGNEEDESRRERTGEKEVDDPDRDRSRKNERAASDPDRSPATGDQRSDDIGEEDRENQQEKDAGQSVQNPQGQRDSEDHGDDDQSMASEGPRGRGRPRLLDGTADDGRCHRVLLVVRVVASLLSLQPAAPALIVTRNLAVGRGQFSRCFEWLRFRALRVRKAKKMAHHTRILDTRGSRIAEPKRRPLAQ
jgi:hypothetical protein